MAIQITEEDNGKIVVVRISGKVQKEDYVKFVPEVDRLVQQHGKLRMLFEMLDFHGWTAGAMWEDTKFAFHHFRNIERLAIIGEKKWQKGMATFCRPFTAAEVRYFEHSQEQEAHDWLQKELSRA
jgi:hypothetical protein